VDVRLSQLSSDGYIDRAFAKMKSYYLSAGWYGEKSIIRATTFSGKERTYQAWGGVPAELLDKDRTYNPYTYDNEVDDYLQTHYQIHWSYQVSRNLNVNAALHYTLGEGFYEQYKDDEDLEDYLLEPLIIGEETIYSSDLIRRKWLDNAFFGGIVNLNYTLGKMSITGGGGWNRYDGDHFGRVIWSEFASNSDIRHQYYFSNGLKTEMNYFTKINYQVLPRINLYTDMQLRHIDYTIDGNDDDLRDITQNHKYNFFNPKAGISMDLAGNHELYFSYSVGNREPKRSNFTDSRPGDEIKPEHLNDFEFGHSYRSSNFSLGINAYFMVMLAQEGEVGPNPFTRPTVFKYNVAYAFAINKLFDIAAEINGEKNGIAQAAGIDVPNTGGDVIFFSPEIHFKFAKNMHLNAAMPIPIYQEFNGTQLAYANTFMVRLGMKF
jgi:iron complex outermembrane receptor protein